MEFESADEANDLLKNGILVETSKGLVCLSLNDALSSNLNLSVELLQNVASQLLLKQNEKGTISIAPKPYIKTEIGDSDGFTSESSDISGIINSATGILVVPSKTESLSSSTIDSKHSESENVTSNVSDSDTNLPKPDIIPKLLKEIKQEPLDGDCHKIPVKKRGGWPKGRKRKPELLHLPPKAPATGYNLYLNDQRKLLKDINLPFHEKTKLIGNKWSSLSLDEKRPYLDKAEEEKRRYREEFKQYRQSGAYQLYLANKRRKRAKYNVLSESDMDATDDIDDEDNEELYCRACDQWFHNLHNKREHLLGRQHQQSIAGAISKELNSDYENDMAATSTSCISFSTSLDESSMDAMPSVITNTKISESIAEAMKTLINRVSKRDVEIDGLNKRLQDTKSKNSALLQQLRLLKEIESSMKKQMVLLKEHEKDMELSVFRLWQVPSLFIVTDLNTTNEEFNIE